VLTGPWSGGSILVDLPTVSLVVGKRTGATARPPRFVAVRGAAPFAASRKAYSIGRPMQGPALTNSPASPTRGPRVTPRAGGVSGPLRRQAGRGRLGAGPRRRSPPGRPNRASRMGFPHSNLSVRS
jgi:hypothetical protein